MTNELQAIDAYMANLRWKRDVNYGGEVSFIRPGDEYAVNLRDGYWELCSFTDSDIDGVAVGRFEAFEEGETLMELLAALRELPRQTPVGNAWILQQVAPHFSVVGNGLYIRTGNSKRKR